MRHRLAFAALLVLVVLLAPQPVPAAVRNCTAALVTSGLCRDAGEVLVSFSVPANVALNANDAIAALINYTPTTNLCTAGRVIERLCGGSGDAVQLGQVIPANQVASRWLRAVLIARTKERAADGAGQTARQAVLDGPDPDISQ